jgi:CDP-glycerol glycerophosphotransferase
MNTSIRSFIEHSLVLLFKIFPLKRNKVLLFSYYGAQYGCNPKYISEKLVSLSPDLKIIWAFLTPRRYDVYGVKKVKYGSVRFLYELCTSKFIITNYRMTFTYWKRKEQIYIQTWHSSLRLKSIEKDAIESLTPDYIRMAQADSGITDFLVSGCAYSSQIFRQAYWYDGKILETGTPRNDLYFKNNEHLVSEIRSKLGIPSNAKLVLYAPTFRQSGDLTCFKLNFEKICSILKDKFGGDWIPMLRLHPHLRHRSSEICSAGSFLDVSRYEDIQELLLIADVLITDYSSLMFDFALLQKPCFLFASDYEDYICKERKLYFDIDKLPFPLSQTEEDLYQEILQFKQQNWLSSLESFNAKIGNFEHGSASRQIADLISSLS